MDIPQTQSVSEFYSTMVALNNNGTFTSNGYTANSTSIVVAGKSFFWLLLKRHVNIHGLLDSAIINKKSVFNTSDKMMDESCIGIFSSTIIFLSFFYFPQKYIYTQYLKFKH